MVSGDCKCKEPCISKFNVPHPSTKLTLQSFSKMERISIQKQIYCDVQYNLSTGLIVHGMQTVCKN